MMKNPEKLIELFINDLKVFLSIEVNPSDINYDVWTAPHTPKDMPQGSGAVYVFSLSSSSDGVAGRVLKVGKAGPNSNPRFRYQHYKSGSAQSTLAGAIENNPLLWGYIGYKPVFGDTGSWIKEYTDRTNYYFKGTELIGLFEVYLKANLGPVFEGSLSSKR